MKSSFIKVGITGNVTGYTRIDSFCGRVSYVSNAGTTFENCYARTNLISTNGSGYDVGGFVGSGNSYGGEFINSYWSGTMTCTIRVGTFKANYDNNNQNITKNIPTLTNCYYNSDLFTLSVPKSISGTPLTTKQFANSSNFTGWDFTNDWYINEEGFPELKFKKNKKHIQ